MSRVINAVVLLLASLEFLRFSTLSNTFSLLVFTMQNAATPLAFLGVACLFVTLAYSCAAFILFGDQVDGYYTLRGAIGRTSLMLVDQYGDFEALQEAYPLASFWFYWSYAFFILFFALNMIIGIITLCFEQVRDKRNAGPWECDTGHRADQNVGSGKGTWHRARCLRPNEILRGPCPVFLPGPPSLNFEGHL